MLKRILEPEVMDTLQDAIEYDSMDFDEVNNIFADRAVELLPEEGLILDLGTGTARIPILILKRNPKLKIVAVDLSENMLRVGRDNLLREGFEEKIILEIIDAKKMKYPDAKFDGVISNSLIHHIPDPMPVFQEINRIVKKEGAILIRDLFRPVNLHIVEELVKAYAGDADEHQKKLFRDSLIASFTSTEIESIVKGAKINNVKIYHCSDRHWSVERKSV